MGESGESVAAEKAALRERFRNVRANLPAAERRAESAAISEAVRALPEVASACLVHVFWPVVSRGEVDTRALIRALADRGVEVALPAVVPGPTPRLIHRRYEGEDALVGGPWGLKEPAASAPDVAPEAVDVVVVPGLAMGRDGSRLGYGGGYYDAFLRQTRAVRLGVVWAACLVDRLPVAPHDARLDAVITGAGVHRVPRNPAPTEA